MHPQYNPHRTFLATWALMESVYDDNLWRKHFSVEDRRNTPLTPPDQTYPYAGGGAVCTTGGLSLRFSALLVPKWIETPWGEWRWYRSRCLNDEISVDKERFRILQDRLDIDHKCSYTHGFSQYAIRSVADIELPPYHRCSMRGLYTCMGEWAALCRIHGEDAPDCRYTGFEETVQDFVRTFEEIDF